MGGARTAVKDFSSPMRRFSEKKLPAVSEGALRTSADLYSINTPRQVRVRLSATNGNRRAFRATPKKHAAASDMSLSHMPGSPIATNRGTGRTAIGPWCGPFEMSASADDHEPPSPTLFMDWAGSAHRSLNGETHRDLKRSSRPHDLPSDYTLAFPGAIDFAPSNRRAELRDHSREVQLAASKGYPKGSAEARCSPRFGGGAAKRHAGHQVFQPSGRFY